MDAWSQLSARLTELDALGGAIGALNWDQQTYLPPEGQDVRGAQIGVLEKIAHERLVADEVGGWIAALERESLDPLRAAAVRLAGRRYRRATAIPGRLVEALAHARTEGFTAWLKAKEADDYALFRAPMQRLIDLNREVIGHHQAAAPTAHPYDALLEDYDPGSTVAELRPMFSRLAVETNKLLDAIEGKQGPPAFTHTLDVAAQKKLTERLLRDLGFDNQRGRMDEAEHPFTSGQHPTDVRLTTHYHVNDFLGGLGSTVHECGHGLYEQGLRTDWDGTGVNRAAGMGIHESQSRFWENTIGRSMAFFRYLAPRMAGLWPESHITAEELYGGANRVERSLIRIYADETTYNLHIIVRFEMELGMCEGRLQSDDLPAAWDEAYGRILGVKAPSAREGVLQDVHWSSGLLGYFPSYTIGNLYAAGLAAQLEKDLPEMWTQVEAGNFSQILGWLRDKVHRVGSLKDPPEIFRDAVGDRDPVADLVDHLWRRQGALYGVTR